MAEDRVVKFCAWVDPRSIGRVVWWQTVGVVKVT